MKSAAADTAAYKLAIRKIISCVDGESGHSLREKFLKKGGDHPCLAKSWSDSARSLSLSPRHKSHGGPSLLVVIANSCCPVGLPVFVSPSVSFFFLLVALKIVAYCRRVWRTEKLSMLAFAQTKWYRPVSQSGDSRFSRKSCAEWQRSGVWS